MSDVQTRVIDFLTRTKEEDALQFDDECECLDCVEARRVVEVLDYAIDAVKTVDALRNELAAAKVAATEWEDTANRHCAFAEKISNELTALRAQHAAEIEAALKFGYTHLFTKGLPLYREAEEWSDECRNTFLDAYRASRKQKQSDPQAGCQE